MKKFAYLTVCTLLICNLAGSESLSADVHRVLDELKGIVSKLESDNQKKADTTKDLNAKDGMTIADELELEATMRDVIEKDNRQRNVNVGSVKDTRRDKGISASDEFGLEAGMSDIIQKDKTVSCTDDKAKECSKILKEGGCGIKENRRMCRRSCMGCCADINPTFCPPRKSLCHNKKWKPDMRYYCPKTCGYCGRAHTLPYCVGTPFGCCWDRSTPAAAPIGSGAEKCPVCKDKKSKIFCRRFERFCTDFNPDHRAGKQIRAFCPETCRVCGANRICMDDPRQKEQCQTYKQDGLCEANKNPMRYWCSKTCGFC